MRRRPSLHTLSLIVAGTAVLSLLASPGCSSTAGSASPSPANGQALIGHTWTATKVSGTALAVDAGTAITAVFNAGKVSGSGGVNRYTASYETRAAEITISQIAATQMAGPPAAMAKEQAYFTALGKASSFAVTGDSMTLMDDQGATLVRYAVAQPTTLEGTTWDALAYNNGRGGLESLAGSSAITATFKADGSVTGNATINHYSTTYTASGSSLSIAADIVTTKMAGPEKLMRQELAYLAALPKTATYTIEGDELWLRDSTGAAMAHYVAR
jgi:heat shock protein HslJ